MDEYLTILSNSIIYQMSLASRELFHSNLWAWMMQRDPRIIRDVFGLDVASPKIKREQQHRDISIHTADGTYIIENKFKAIPTEQQLKEYTEGCENFQGGILTGIREPSIKLPKGWGFLGYGEIAKRLTVFFENNTDSALGDEKSIIEKYVEMVNVLCAIVEDKFESDPALICLSPKDYCVDGLFAELHLDDLLVKQYADDFCKYLYSRIEDKKKAGGWKQPSGWELKIEADFSDKSGIVNVFLYTPNEQISSRQKLYYRNLIGIQLQGNQYRRCCADAGESKRGLDDLFHVYRSKSWFSELEGTGKTKTIRGYSTSMSPRGGKQYNKYQTEQYNFVYQYYNMDETLKQYANLADRIIEDMTIAINIIKM